MYEVKAAAWPVLRILLVLSVELLCSLPEPTQMLEDQDWIPPASFAFRFSAWHKQEHKYTLNKPFEFFIIA